MMKRPRSRSGRVRLAALLILCLFALPLAAVACGKAPAGGAATAVPAAARETAPPAQETATPEPTESERIAAGGTQMRLNAFFWDAGFPWGAFHHNTQEFVIFTPENAVYGHSDTIDEARSYLETGVVTGTVEIGKTLTYTVTQAYYIPVRDLEGEYLASAVICMHDPAGEIPDFTYTLDFYHQLISSDFHDSIDCVEMQYFYHDILDFVFEPARRNQHSPTRCPTPISGTAGWTSRNGTTLCRRPHTRKTTSRIYSSARIRFSLAAAPRWTGLRASCAITKDTTSRRT